MTRNIPEDFNYLIKSFYKDINKTLDGFETKIEKHIITICNDIDINASIKTDKFSLPYTHEIEYNTVLTSYINDVFRYNMFLRKILKEILVAKHNNKIRFYVFIELYFINMFNKGLTYKFRYYLKEEKNEI